MKLGGETLDGPRIETVVIPFGQRKLIFKAQLVKDFEDFDKLCPRPMPPQVMRPGGVKSYDPEHPEFKAALDKWAGYRANWLILKSLAATPGLEWETVNMSQPDTWGNFYKELDKSGLSTAELTKIMEIVHLANGLDQTKIDEATKRFLMEEAAPKEPSSLTAGDPSTQSGELAKG